LLLVAVVAALLSTAASASAAPTPERLYKALLKGVPSAQLPGYSVTQKVRSTTPSKAARARHIVGEVKVAILGPDAADFILYGVFPNSDDAVSDLRRAHPPGSHLHLHLVSGGVPGYTNLPNRMWEGSITGKNGSGHTVTNGATIVEVAKGKVLVLAITGSVSDTSKGNVRHALALLKSGLLHLRKVEARLAQH
jgi:hypothetical protein